MLDRLIELDKWLFFAINGFNSPLFDSIMVFFSAKLVWIPLYVYILFCVFFGINFNIKSLNNRQISAKNLQYSILVFIGIIVTFALTDSIGNLFKESVQRLRPCQDPLVMGMTRLLEGKGGLYGFVSNHAANVFGIATITSLVFKKNRYTILILLWAFVVSYSRIYVGKHYPLDIICGGLIGALIGYIIYRFVKYLSNALYRRQ